MISIKRNELNNNLDKLKDDEEKLITLRDKMNVKKKEFEDSKNEWKEQVELIKNLKNSVKLLKEFLRENKRTRIQSLNGFTKPVKVAKKLADFMNIGEDELTTRNDIWKFIYKYLKDNNLFISNDKRCINIEVNECDLIKNILNINEKNNNIYSIRKNIEYLIIKN